MQFIESLGDNDKIISYSGSSFWEWVEGSAGERNKDEVSRFWARALQYLNAYVGYYFSLDEVTGNLRNSCLKMLTPIFFAYSRNTYENFATNTIFDALTSPGEHFFHGEWTISLSEKPYHNVAIDERHECGITGVRKRSLQGLLTSELLSLQILCHT